MYIGSSENGLYIKCYCKSPSGGFEKELTDENYKILSDGCNIIFCRYLAIANFPGNLSINRITIDGDIIKCKYVKKN